MSAVLDTGGGSMSFRLEIEGLATAAVTRRDMESASDSTGRARKTGLSVRGVKLSQEADLPRATVEASGATFKFADYLGVWTAAFNTAPTCTTWLAANLSAADTSITVKSTQDWPASGYLYIDSEVIAYASITSGTTFDITGGRGKFGTLAQAHYIPDGRFLRVPEITNQPVSLEGRRVRLSLYGGGDSKTGDGEQIWLGMVASEPRMVGPEWSIMVDPISRILDGEIGNDLGEEVTPRGIYIPTGWNLYIGWDGTALVPFESRGSQRVEMQGFWNTQQDFLDALNVKLAALSIGDTAIYARAAADGTYFFQIQVGAGADAVSIVGVMGPNEPFFENASLQLSDDGYDVTDPFVLTVSATTTYYCFGNPARSTMPGAGKCPRGVFTTFRDIPGAEAAGVGAAYPSSRVYLGGAISVPSNTNLALVTWPASGSSDAVEYTITSSDASTRSLVLGRAGVRPGDLSDLHWYTPDSLPTIRLGRVYNTAYGGTGTYDLMQTLRLAAADQVNTGAVPLIRSGDFNAAAWYGAYRTDTPESLNVSALAAHRRYSSLKTVKLSEYVCPDLQLAGLFLSFDSDGALTVERLRLASPVEVGTLQITQILKEDGPPPYERNAIGSFNTFVVHEGYNPVSDEYTQAPVIVRDVAAYGRSPLSRSIIVEPKSTYLLGAVKLEDIVAAAAGVLGIYGNPYAYTTISVPLTAFASTLGSTVSITTNLLPNASGTRGVEDLVGIVTAREIDLYGARIQLTVLLSTRRIAGYAPSALVLSQTNPSGNTWAITLDPDYFRTGEDAADHFVALDRAKIYRFDSLTTGQAYGVVVSVVGNVVTVLFDGVWNPTATADQEWVLGFAPSDDGAVSANQRRYAVCADSFGIIDWQPEPDASAFTWAV